MDHGSLQEPYVGGLHSNGNELFNLLGVLNKLLCVLWAGGTVEFMKSASADGLWHRLAEQQDRPQDETTNAPLTMFMAVPTVYARMIEATKNNQMDPDVLAKAQKTLRSMRLNVRNVESCHSMFLAWLLSTIAHAILRS
jgi:hypothetical protein